MAGATFHVIMGDSDASSSSAIVPRTTNDRPTENRLVFSGGSSRPRSAAFQPTRLLTDGGATDAPAAGQDHHDPEPETKRQRLDEYEIALLASDLPTSYAEAMASPEAKNWKEAIRSEIKSHIRNHTWDMVMRPWDGRVIDSKWVFARKYDEHGNIARDKARLVARGYLQMRGVDYMETF
ncbi:hypothetical protein P43SY_012050 [Pythium insidiosum]|uniref:Reverse transcriptase Ty1/copia-type domain-containing protein n=1 Tax=Pythium insidiosum TaxID=114742 RepID=A0AAD5L8M9_PYTIN|nr:hypothetical protein P43SY_012050 [Pythium insidiosum]